jgi:hypothetical protein
MTGFATDLHRLRHLVTAKQNNNSSLSAFIRLLSAPSASKYFSGITPVLPERHDILLFLL